MQPPITDEGKYNHWSGFINALKPFPNNISAHKNPNEEISTNELETEVGVHFSFIQSGHD